MTTDIYDRLARHLDNLPGGFPATESGVELRILRRLFTPADAELALTLALIPEDARVIARRAGITPEEAAQRLDAMEHKGLLFAVHPKGGAPMYMTSQFVVGIWEYQVNNLDADFIRDFEEYRPILLDTATWRKVPQLRTVPVGKAIAAQPEVMAYERAEELVQAHKRFAVAPCICRREAQVMGEPCDKPLETCLSFGVAADFYQRNGLGRSISKEEALAILQQAEKAGLVLQPGNAQNALFLCTCCGCCCGVLRSIKSYPKPAEIVSTPFVAVLNRETCAGCGICVARCQMEAIQLDGDTALLNPDRCIGCGLCVTTCATESCTLVRKPEAEQRKVPKDVTETSLWLAQARGKMGAGDLVGMQVRSTVDRILAPR